MLFNLFFCPPGHLCTRESVHNPANTPDTFTVLFFGFLFFFRSFENIQDFQHFFHFSFHFPTVLVQWLKIHFPNLWTTFFFLSCSSSVLRKLHLTVASPQLCIISHLLWTFNACSVLRWSFMSVSNSAFFDWWALTAWMWPIDGIGSISWRWEDEVTVMQTA